MDSTTTNNHQSPSCCEPLHSQSSPQSMSMPLSVHPHRRSSSSSSFPSSRFSTFFLITLLLTLSSIPQPIEAKYRLIPKRRTKTQPQNKPKQEQTQSMFHRNNVNTNTKTNNTHPKSNTKQVKGKSSSSSTPNSPLIVLKPKKKQITTHNLKLEAQIHTNEDGEKVLKLSPESSQMVHSAMGTGSQSDTDSLDVIPQEVESAKMEMASGIEEGESGNGNNNNAGPGHQVFFYDPEDLKTKPGEEPLPKQVFDEHGNEVDMAGKEALLVKPHVEDGKVSAFI